MVEHEPRYPRALVDGFEMSMYVSYDDCGVAWVRSPDGGTASLIWETGEPAYFRISTPAEPDGRWGTFAVQQPLPPTSDAEAAAYLRAILPALISHWRAWAAVHRL